jgi:hypothetical protein
MSTEPRDPRTITGCLHEVEIFDGKRNVHCDQCGQWLRHTPGPTIFTPHSDLPRPRR